MYNDKYYEILHVLVQCTVEPPRHTSLQDTFLIVFQCIDTCVRMLIINNLSTKDTSIKRTSLLVPMVTVTIDSRVKVIGNSW